MTNKVAEGDPISATKWNDIAERVERRTVGSLAAAGSIDRVLCRVKNSSGRDCALGEFLQINDFIGPIWNGPFDAQSSMIYNAITPVWHTAIDNACVTAEPIRNGELGWAVLSGHCVIKTGSAGGAGRFAMIDPATPYLAIRADAGIAKVLDRIDADYLACVFRREANRWQYKLEEDSQAPGTTTAKLYKSDLEGYLTETFELSDPLGIADTDQTGFEGFCELRGNEFHVGVGPC